MALIVAAGGPYDPTQGHTQQPWHTQLNVTVTDRMVRPVPDHCQYCEKYWEIPTGSVPIKIHYGIGHVPTSNHSVGIFEVLFGGLRL
jgi:hypothetical protein